MEETANVEDNTEDEETTNKLIFAYALPSASAVVGSVIVLSVLLLSGCYLRNLRKRSSQVGVAKRNSHTK